MTMKPRIQRESWWVSPFVRQRGLAVGDHAAIDPGTLTLCAPDRFQLSGNPGGSPGVFSGKPRSRAPRSLGVSAGDVHPFD